MERKIIRNVSISIFTFFTLISCNKGTISNNESQTTKLSNETKQLLFSISWTPCEKTINHKGDKFNFECGKMDVPLNWKKKDGDKIKISFVRSKAKKTSERIGSLILNPGGPGGSSIEMAAAISASPHFNNITSRFDIIGMDPRGVGESSAVTCEKSWEGNTYFPKNKDEYQALITENTNYYQSCLKGTGERLHYIDTVNVAHDLDAARIALGESKLNFLGLSYGTAIAATYAEIFPNNSRALVLDGVLDHSQNLIDFGKTEAMAAELVLANFVSWCTSNTDCELNRQNVFKIIDNIVKKANESPIHYDAKDKSKTMNGEQIQGAIQGFLAAGEEEWLDLAKALNSSKNGDASSLVKHAVADSHSQIAITCLDYPSDIKSWEQFLEYKETVQSVSPHLGANVQAWRAIAVCTGWHNPVNNPPHNLHITKEQPALIVTARHDPATSFKWAERVASQIPGNSFVIYEGNIHVSYFKSNCIFNLVNNFLISGNLPLNNTICSI